MTLAVGVDVGGTKIAVGLVDVRDGRVLARDEIPTDQSDGSDVLLRRMVDVTRTVRGSYDIVGTGVGLCELVSDDGEVASAQSLPWSAADLIDAFDGPVTIESDVRAAAMAEARYTSAAAAAAFFFLAIGTGISSTFVLAGTPWSGAHGHAIAFGGVRLEPEASGHSLRRQYGTTDLGAAIDANPATAFNAADRIGDDLAVVVNVLDPALVVIGGGLGRNDRFRDRIEARMRTGIFSPAVARVPVRASALGEDAGVIGAALAAVAR